MVPSQEANGDNLEKSFNLLHNNAGLGSSVGCTSDWRSRVRSPPRPATFFCGD